jgi:hypothetical protein
MGPYYMTPRGSAGWVPPPMNPVTRLHMLGIFQEIILARKFSTTSMFYEFKIKKYDKFMCDT